MPNFKNILSGVVSKSIYNILGEKQSMNARIESLKQKHLTSLHRTIDVVAKERRYFVMTRAPKLSDVHDLASESSKAMLPFYVACVNNKVIGWVNVTKAPGASRKHVGDLGMGLVPKYRRKGLGSKLLTKTLKHGFEKTGLLRIQLEVYTDNIPAIYLYTKLGFQYEGVKRKAVRINGKYKDAIVMAIVR